MARRHTLTYLAGIAVAGLALSACGSSSLTPTATTAASKAATAAATSAARPAPSTRPSSRSSRPRSRAAGKIVIGTDATYQPNEYLDADGKTVIGMDVDLFDAVAAKFGVKTEWVPPPSTRSSSASALGQVRRRRLVLHGQRRAQ
jgi:polar amino acid transport system substrate-binding protein